MLKYSPLFTGPGFFQDLENTTFMVLATEHFAYLPRHWKADEAGLNMSNLKLVLSCSSYIHVVDR